MAAIKKFTIPSAPSLIGRHLRAARRQARVGEIESPIGRLFFAESDRGLAAIHFLDVETGERTLERLRRKFELEENEPAARKFAAEIRRYLRGDFSEMDRPLDLSLIESDFQRRSSERLRKVPPGSVISYAALAAAIGHPDSQRAIGNTMASNPVPIFVPCHRVVRSDGSLGNYGGGVSAKAKLLRIEGVEIDRDMRVVPWSPAGRGDNW
ncbi:MAG: methylated-DNA--[protein]-cysteine S-methyltransferase [Candidatus Binataceae bacterium]